MKPAALVRTRLAHFTHFLVVPLLNNGSLQIHLHFAVTLSMHGFQHTNTYGLIINLAQRAAPTGRTDRIAVTSSSFPPFFFLEYVCS